MRSAIAVILTLKVLQVLSDLTCNSYTCDGGELLPGNVCLQFNETSQLSVLSPCSSSTDTCPSPKYWVDQQTVYCTEWKTRKSFSSDSFEDYYDAVSAALGDQCDVEGIVSLCDYSVGLRCHCMDTNCTCVQGTAAGAGCITSDVECIPGYVCSNNICVAMYSLGAGEVATDATACQSGALISQYKVQVCQQPSMTQGGIPRTCVNSFDCIGTRGDIHTECSCGVNLAGKAYCALHFNDDPMVQNRLSFGLYNYSGTIYYKFLANYYQYIQGTTPDCLRNVWRDYGEHERDVSTATLLTLMYWIVLAYS